MLDLEHKGTRPRTASAAALWAPACALLLQFAVIHAAHAQDPTVANTTSAQPSAFANTPSPIGNLVRPDTSQPLNLQGDELVYDSASQTVTARGNVEISFNNFALRADEVVYDQRAGTLTALGNVVLTEPGGIVTRGERITLTDDFRDGFVESLSVVGRDDSRITARRAIRRDGNVAVFEDGKFTPCKAADGKPPTWCLTAGRVTHDRAAGVISYENAQFELFGIPVFALPYFEHADPSVKRKSGFLQPTYRYSTDLGVSVSIPYYFALSPHYDFLFDPAYFSEQGLMFQGEWRQRFLAGSSRVSYSVDFAAIDQDSSNLPNKDRSLDGLRGFIHTRGKVSLSSWWSAGWNVMFESDDSFRRFYKFDSILDNERINSINLIGQSERNYFSVWGYHFGRLSPTRSPVADSQVHPVIDWNYIFGDPILGGELRLDVNTLSLSRELNLGPGQKEINSHNRVSADVKWRRTLIDQVGITYTPFANLRGDFFLIEDGVDASTGLDFADRSRARGVAAAGVLAEYPWVARTASASHVVAPIGQMIARTSLGDDQATLPNEDARSLVFEDTNLFEIDKFSGFDRIESGSRANVGLQYTFQSDFGGHARILAGLSFSLADDNPFSSFGSLPGSAGPQPGITPNSGLETRRSDFVLGTYLSPSQNLDVVAQARFDETNLALRQADVFVRASYGPVFASATYGFKDGATIDNNLVNPGDDQQEIVANIGLKLTDFWQVGAGIRYDIDERKILQDSFTLRYADDCFVFAVSYTETFVTNPISDLEKDRTLMVRFDLKHLGQFQTQSDLLNSLGGSEVK